MGSIVGFTVFHDLDPESVKTALGAQDRALFHFEHLEHKYISLGETRLELWGHQQISDCIFFQPDGAVLALIGSPHGKVDWLQLHEKLSTLARPEDFELPWDGRVILLKISADGRRWTMWNDWLGSIPVFYTQIVGGRIASTLEPVIVTSAGFSPNDIFMPGLVSLLINGHYLSDWTLFKGMKTVQPDSVIKWDDNGFHSRKIWTVQPSQDRWEAGWDELIDEMYELSHKAIAEVLKTQSIWILPLSSGLDSRLIAGVAADVGTNVYTYAWGGSDTTDVVYSRQIARTLGFQWKHIDLPRDFLVKYTTRWADLFGSSMHFHGMYQMCFLDSLKTEPNGSILSGFVGEVLAGDSVQDLQVHSTPGSCQILNDWYVHWNVKDIETLMKIPLDNVLSIIASTIEDQINNSSGARYQNISFLELWNRQRLFTYFQATLSDYWRGVGTPFINRAYARFCLSLPRASLDERRLLKDVYRRYFGRLAVIPGTYANEPLIVTGRYLIKKRILKLLHKSLQYGPFMGFDQVPLRMDMQAIRVTGEASLWPIYDAWDQLSEWLDVKQLEVAYQAIMTSMIDVRPQRKLQAAQALAYRLL